MSIYPQWNCAAPGWLCPRCNTVNAPTTLCCYSCAPPRAQVAKDTTSTSADSPWINRLAPEATLDAAIKAAKRDEK